MGQPRTHSGFTRVKFPVFGCAQVRKFTVQAKARYHTRISGINSYALDHSLMFSSLQYVVLELVRLESQELVVRLGSHELVQGFGSWELIAELGCRSLFTGVGSQ